MAQIIYSKLDLHAVDLRAVLLALKQVPYAFEYARPSCTASLASTSPGGDQKEGGSPDREWISLNQRVRREARVFVSEWSPYCVPNEEPMDEPRVVLIVREQIGSGRDDVEQGCAFGDGKARRRIVVSAIPRGEKGPQYEYKLRGARRLEAGCSRTRHEVTLLADQLGNKLLQEDTVSLAGTACDPRLVMLTFKEPSEHVLITLEKAPM